MKNKIFYLFMFFCISSYAQNGTTFEVEKLSKPEKLIFTQSYDDICEKLILSDAGLRPYEVKNNTAFPYNIIAKSEISDSLVSFSYNSFFNGMYQAYADHRPFILSPDMIWLLISQGFAQHVNANQESMRNYFVDFSGKQTLMVRANQKLEDPAFAWEEVFPEFTKQIEQHTGNNLAQLLTCNFSTTTAIEKVASEVTVMGAMKPYFEFIVFYIVCGIPEITLEGTPDDWQKVLDKTKELKKYDLEWWVSELEPLLTEFVKASKGDVNQEFWRNMFKYHSQEKYGAPKIIDGWIVKFFPYDKDGKRNNLKQLEGNKSLPDEIVKVDLKYLEESKGVIKEIPLELWAGFIGLEQNKSNFALRPKIGWMIRKKDVEMNGLKSKLSVDAQREGMGSGISIRVKEFPLVLLEFEKIKSLEIEFIGNIDIPNDLAKVKIKDLRLSGKISEEGIKRIKDLFPDTNIIINREQINKKYSNLL